MQVWNRVWSGCVLSALFGTAFGPMQTQSQTPQDTQTALHAMAQTADVIFTGQVTAVRRHEGTGGATGVVEIEFAVQDAVRGVSGGSYTVREWAGLWPGGEEPFRAGQRYLMLLHASGPAGFSSPVGGMDGAVPIHGTRAAVGPTVDVAAGSAGQMTLGGAGGDLTGTQASEPTDGLVMDLGWVATRVVRPVLYAPPLSARPILKSTQTLNGGVSPLGLGAGVDEFIPAGRRNALAVQAPQTQSYATVLTLLRQWEKEDHAGR